jgi:hypothetical protein
MAATTQVNNGEPAVPQENTLFIEHPAVVGPPMREHIQGCAEVFPILRLMPPTPSEYAAHQ